MGYRMGMRSPGTWDTYITSSQYWYTSTLSTRIRQSPDAPGRTAWEILPYTPIRVNPSALGSSILITLSAVMLWLLCERRGGGLVGVLDIEGDPVNQGPEGATSHPLPSTSGVESSRSDYLSFLRLF